MLKMIKLFDKLAFWKNNNNNIDIRFSGSGRDKKFAGKSGKSKSQKLFKS